MAKSDARFGYKANLNRESHDLSRRFGFTACPGQLLPIFADFATPGDSYYIKHDLAFLRTRPLAAPAMIDVKVHYETFFVPLQMIFQLGENTITSIKTLQSSNYNYGSLMNNNFPLFDQKFYRDSLFPSGVVQDNDPIRQKMQKAFRLADFLGLNAGSFLGSVIGGSGPGDASNDSTGFYAYAPSYFPWQILAYNTIWQYYFRLDDKTQNHNWDCNFDRFYDQSTPVQFNGSEYEFMTIHQRPWDFDYFTSIYRSPIVSNANLQQVLPGGYYNPLQQKGVAKITTGGVLTTLNNDAKTFGPLVSSTFDNTQVQGAVSTSVIRQMFANEKLAMITGRTKKTYDSQVLAHFGVEVPHDVKHDLILIGRDTYMLHVGEVTSLADTTAAPLGELAGKGWASGEGKDKHKFTAPCHGIVMTLFSVEPLKRYTVGFERHNSVVGAFDFPQPEFDRLGNVPMFRYETGHNTSSGSLSSDIIGWKERYYQWKRRSDRVSMAFMAEGRVTGTFPYRANEFHSYMLVSSPFNAADKYASRPDLDSVFYIAPDSMDSLMLVDYFNGWKWTPSEGEGSDGENWFNTPWMVYSRDPFIVDSFEKVTKVSWMSKDGEPVYPY